ncbi:hypothetical protein WH8501_22425 [Crocosphaera watsonii WH 8501]|uniref:hypothetical protein n=1 Tax=Crocosphaera watsonii TaxID=263511 RepID=UPI0005B2A159
MVKSPVWLLFPVIYKIPDSTFIKPLLLTVASKVAVPVSVLFIVPWLSKIKTGLKLSMKRAPIILNVPVFVHWD